MTTIKATCPQCGEVALTPDDIELRITDTDDDGQPIGNYAFICPKCDAEVRKPADHRVVRLLQSGGVPAIDATERAPKPPAQPQKPPHPEVKPGTYPTTLADVLDRLFGPDADPVVLDKAIEYFSEDD